MIKQIGNWSIEYPTTCNGNQTKHTAFVTGTYMSGFVTLYGNGEIGVDSGLALPKKPIEYLRTLSRNITDAERIK